jgi:hypothetical protein
LVEKCNLVEDNNKLNISSHSSSSLSSSSSSSFISSFGFSSDFIPFTSLKSSDLYHSTGALMVADVDSNNEDAIDRLVKIRDNIPMYRDKNSLIYALVNNKTVDIKVPFLQSGLIL